MDVSFGAFERLSLWMREQDAKTETEQVTAATSDRVVYLDREQTSIIAGGLKAVIEETRLSEPWVATGADNILLMTERSSALVTISAAEKRAGVTIGRIDHEVPGSNRIFLRLAEQLLLEDALLLVVRAAHGPDPETARLAWEMIEWIDAGDTLVCSGKDMS